ncbi:hypothetical protein JTB14_010498 [Gonioctena quinquepunctata]|nr:hypothetical protein JTB14_010498 [Gonioctena quinquepunctata]
MRVSRNHWRVLLDFVEVHSEIITNKFSSHLQGKQNNKLLWEQLTLKSNSLGQGKRSSEEWKKTLADWKSKTKLKATKNVKDSVKTGGGPSCSVPLTCLEERLLSLMGRAATFGDDTVAERGIKRKFPEPPPAEPNEILEDDVLFSDITENVIEEVVVEHNFSAVGGRNILDQVTATSDRGSRKKNKIEKMHEEILNVLCNIDKSIGAISTSWEDIAGSLKKFAHSS